MLIETLFAITALHGAVGAWDEIIPITLVVLSIALGIVIFLAARRFKPEDEGEGVEPATPDRS